MKGENYRTRQRKVILSAIKHQKKNFSAKDIYQSLNCEIGLTTIYRTVEKLAEEGIILQVSVDNNTTKYQYIEACDNKDHFYLSCENCGSLTHIDCKKIQGLTDHILEEHQFKPINSHIIIKGYCKKCIK